MQRPTYQPNINELKAPFEKGSRLVYGTSGLGGVWGKVDPEESIDCLLYAFEHDIRSLDTSPSYHRSEEFVGKALGRWSGELPFVSTKVGRLKTEKADDCIVDYSTERMRRSVLESLEKLRVNQVDLLFLHEPHLVPLNEIDRILDTLRSFKAEGYTNMIGVGGNPTADFRPYITADNFQVVSGYLKMDACNLTAFEKDIPHFQQHNIAYYAASALHMSLLGNRFERYTNDPPDDEWITMPDVKTAGEIKKIADWEGMKISTLAQRYLFSIREADRVVMGARKIGQIRSNVTDWKAGVLPETLFNEVTRTIIDTRS